MIKLSNLIKIEVMLKSMILVFAIASIAYGVKELSTIHMLIGGICAGVYNDIKD